MNEANRRQRNTEKLSELFPTFRARIVALIQGLEARGVRPRIQEAWRSPADQLAAFESGHSKLKFGFHNVTGPGDVKEALAVDLLDDDNPLNASVAYLLQVASAAEAQGLTTGIRWGLPTALVTAVDAALAAKDWQRPVKVGWDPTHVQPVGLTASDAKAGERPV
jgi:hypothetical protein